MADSITSLVYAKKELGSIVPVFILDDGTNPLNQEYVTASKCYCAECKKTYDINPSHIEGMDDNDVGILTSVYYKPDLESKTIEEARFQRSQDLQCPECHNNVYFCTIHPSMKDGVKKWTIPETVDGRAIYKTVDSNGRIIGITDSIVINSAEISEDGTVTKKRTLYSEKTDLVKNAVQVVKSDYTTGKSLNPVIRDSDTGYRYLDDTSSSMSNTSTYGIMKKGRIGPMIKSIAIPTAFAYNSLSAELTKLQNNSDKEIPTTYNAAENTFKIEPSAFMPESNLVTALTENPETDPSTIDRYAPSALEKNMQEALKIKRGLIESRFDRIESMPDVFKHADKNGMCITEHHIGSNENNTDISYNIMGQYMNLITNYPAAYEYACERAQRAITDHEFAMARKQKENPNFIVKPVPDSAKARYLRDEVSYVEKQLAAVDNNILKTIQQSTSLDDMKKKLQFFAFGTQETKKVSGTAVPSTIRLDGDKTKADPFDATKSLVAAFDKNPIGVANTVYTCHKMGITDINYLNQMMSAVNEFDAAAKNFKLDSNRLNGANINAGTISPIRSKAAIRFARNYVNSHNPGEMIQIYSSPGKYDLLIESYSLYNQISSHCKIADSQSVINENKHDIEKANIRAYLQQKTIKDAYVDYIEKYGDKTVDTINMYAKEIHADQKFEEIKKFYDQNGINATMSRYANDLKGIQDPKKTLDEFKSEDQRELVLTTRDNKPLFPNRTLKEIHDELSIMAKKCVTSNVTIDYTDKERNMEGEYESKTGKYSFHLMKNSLDFIRTATELSNCVGGQHYIDSAQQKRSYILYMQNELGQKVACIELGGKPDKLICRQFQAAHDNALPKECVEAANAWLKDKKIDTSDCRDVEKFGSGESIYGDTNADYHTNEIDETTQDIVSKDANKTAQARRYKLAKQIYGVNDQGEINVPDAPAFA